MTQRKNALDFRSDTVTQPSQAMRATMAAAIVGDDYYRDDPTVRALEAEAASLLGKEAALLTPSGTQSNLIATLAQCERGAACVLGTRSHSYTRELGGMAITAGIQSISVPTLPDGGMAPGDLKAALTTHGFLSAPRRLLMLENTMEGKVLDPARVDVLCGIGREAGLATHLDGARIFNAAAASGRSPDRLAAPFDTVSFCLSKGLGAPIGSVLAGSATLIERARIHRQALGGAMRQAGIIAAAGLFALTHNRRRLLEDHHHAERLFEIICKVDGLEGESPQTNILFVDVRPDLREPLSAALQNAGIQVSGTAERHRWVTHLGITKESLEKVEDVLTSLEAFA